MLSEEGTMSTMRLNLLPAALLSLLFTASSGVEGAVTNSTSAAPVANAALPASSSSSKSSSSSSTSISSSSRSSTSSSIIASVAAASSSSSSSSSLSSPSVSRSSIASSSSTSAACNKCTVTAAEAFHTYPYSIETEEFTLTNVVVPMVTVHSDGRLETNYVTQTQNQNPTAPGNGSPSIPTDPYATLTWVQQGVTLTYPTTYVQFFDLSGGTFFPISSNAGPTASCTYDNQPLKLPISSVTGLIVPLGKGTSVNVDSPTPISAPIQIHSYLDSIPDVASQFGGTPVASCAWTKTIGSLTTESPHATETSVGVAVQKVSVSKLTEVTANQVIITAPDNGGATQTSAAQTPALAHTEQTATNLNVPAAGTNPPQTAAAQQQQQGGGAATTQATGGGLGAIIASIINPGNSANGGSGGAQGGSNAQPLASGGGAGANSQGGGSGGGITQNGGTGAGNTQNGGSGGGVQTGGATGNQQSGGRSGQATGVNGQSGSSGQLPAPLVVVINGSPTTITPTVGSVTAYVLGPGSTLILGGSPITVSGTAVLAPGGTTTGGIGGAIASGLGYTGPLASNNLGPVLRAPNVPMGALAAVGGAIGALAFGL